MYFTARLALLTALGVLPIVLLGTLGLSPWAVLGGWLLLLLVFVAADAFASANPRTLEVTRRLPPRARRFETTEASIVLRNLGGKRLRGTVRDAWQPTAGVPAGDSRAHIDVPAGEARRTTVRLTPRRRGALRSEFVMVRALGPIGLAGRQARHDVLGRLTVLPEFRSRKHLPSRLARLRELDGNTSVQVRGQGTEFDSLREYVRGDDVRSIDWRATARSATTMLRTWRPERDRHVVILVDTGRTAAARVGDGTRLDASLEAALLLGALASQGGDHVHLLMVDRTVRARVTGVDGAPLLAAMSEAMAPVHARLVDTDWRAAFASLRTVTTRPSLIVVLTAQDSIEAARGFLGALPQPNRGTTLLVASATDGDLARLARDTQTRETVYLAATAERTILEAALVTEAVSRAGGEALSAEPETLPQQIADRYLSLKAAGRL